MRQFVDWSSTPMRAGRPPARVVRAAKAAFGQRVPPSELAELLWDSDAVPGGGPTPGGGLTPGGGPTPGGVRRLMFGTDGLGIELVIGPAVAGRRPLSGRLVPPVPAALSLVRDTGEPVPVPLDAAGRFTVEGVAPGLLRLRSTRPGRRPLLTAWVLVE